MKDALLALLLACSFPAIAADVPQPPCASAPRPAYARSGEQPTVQVWEKAALVDWQPPACTGWAGGSTGLLVALAGTFQHTGTADQLLGRFGAISALRGIHYWSAADKEWRVLVTDAVAFGGADSTEHRGDFAASEMMNRDSLYFGQRDSRSTGEVAYKLRVRDAGADHLVLEYENVSAVRAFIVTVFRPGELKYLYFLRRQAGATWGIYLLLSANSAYAEGNEASFINRAVAFYRHFTGAETGGAPPLAR